MLRFVLIILICTLVAGGLWREELTDRLRNWYLQLPAPKYSVQVLPDRQVAMRDGSVLYTDVYLPVKKGRHLTVVMRTPYGKNNREHRNETLGRIFAGQGIACVIQDIRGKGESDGVFYPFRHDAQDGHDTIDWIVRQPWSSGKVAPFGFSYLGVAAWLSAKEGHPAIVTLIPWFSGSETRALWYDGPILYAKQALFWLAKNGGREARDYGHDRVNQVLHSSAAPLERDQLLTGEVIGAYQDVLSHPTNDHYWRELSSPSSELKLDVPILFGSGWYDRFLGTTLDDFRQMQASASSQHRASQLMIGPWMHNPIEENPYLPNKGEASFLYQFRAILNWCAQMEQEQPTRAAPVRYYVLGKNVWKSAHTWPPEDVVMRHWFLGAHEMSPNLPVEGAIGRLGNARVPSIGSTMLYGEQMNGPRDQSFLEANPAVCYWTSDPLETDLTIAGACQVQLSVPSQEDGLDLHGKLTHMSADGQDRLICVGSKRFDGLTERVSFALQDIAYTVPKGDRLRLYLLPSHFPSHDLHPQLASRANELPLLSLKEHPASLQIPILSEE